MSIDRGIEMVRGTRHRITGIDNDSVTESLLGRGDRVDEEASPAKSNKCLLATLVLLVAGGAATGLAVGLRSSGRSSDACVPGPVVDVSPSGSHVAFRAASVNEDYDHPFNRDNANKMALFLNASNVYVYNRERPIAQFSGFGDASLFSSERITIKSLCPGEQGFLCDNGTTTGLSISGNLSETALNPEDAEKLLGCTTLKDCMPSVLKGLGAECVNLSSVVNGTVTAKWPSRGLVSDSEKGTSAGSRKLLEAAMASARERRMAKEDKFAKAEETRATQRRALRGKY